jgi:hypothetical protein
MEEERIHKLALAIIDTVFKTKRGEPTTKENLKVGCYFIIDANIRFLSESNYSLFEWEQCREEIDKIIEKDFTWKAKHLK